MTPNSDSNRGVTADLVKTRRSSSNAVEVNPDDLSININKAYVESHKKKSTLSKIIKAISRKTTPKGPSLYDGRSGGSRKSSSFKKYK
jgi:hypothetical protein